jgi:hypothetical protein
MLTILIPVFEKTETVQKFLELNEEILKSNILIVIDSGGGSALKKFAAHYEEFPRGDLGLARRHGINLAETEFIFNLDVDTVVPVSYINDATQILELNKDVFAVALDYENLQGHLAFGTSAWKTDILKKLYDYSIQKVSDGQYVKVGSHIYSNLNNGWCECTYMWRKLKASGGRLETLPMRAKHLK